MKSYNQRTLELWRRELRYAQARLALMRRLVKVASKALLPHEQDVCDALDGVWEAQQACVRDDWAGYRRDVLQRRAVGYGDRR